ncbi:MAG: cell filamentation protein Fic [Bacteroidetes bacterium RIFOXYC12_FULL_35_7]|nr:MAG: cell filamentation protein Fic [Bacteroidetes bacterium RIFOXYC12_FULL_35_7]
MWQDIKKYREKYKKLGLQNSIDYEKFCMISIVYNSSKIEGCSLSETDTKILIENDLTAKGKPLRDHLMVKDHYNAFLSIRERAFNKEKITIDFIKDINAKVMSSTGGIIKSMAGDFDTSKGDLRFAQVYVDKKYFPNYKEVPKLLEKLCTAINSKIDTVKENDIIKLSADIHYNLVNIHPFGDGNGRTSRLFMNYIQLYHQEPLIKVFTEDRAKYISALNDTEENENPDIFRNFICSQQIKFYKAEIKKFSNLKSEYIYC